MPERGLLPPSGLFFCHLQETASAWYTIFRISYWDIPVRSEIVKVIRKQLAEGVYLTCLPARKFKTSLLSAQFVTPLTDKNAAVHALLPAVLRRGTMRFPDMGRLAVELDLL